MPARRRGAYDLLSWLRAGSRSKASWQTPPAASFLIGGFKIDGHEEIAGQPQGQNRQGSAQRANNGPDVDFGTLLPQYWAISNRIEVCLGRQVHWFRGAHQTHGLVMQVGSPAGDNINDNQGNSLVTIAGTLGGVGAAVFGPVLVARPDGLDR